MSTRTLFILRRPHLGRSFYVAPSHYDVREITADDLAHDSDISTLTEDEFSINTYANEVETMGSTVDIDEAREIASEDPGLVYAIERGRSVHLAVTFV
jgi:hypothetical protein